MMIVMFIVLATGEHGLGFCLEGMVKRLNAFTNAIILFMIFAISWRVWHGKYFTSKVEPTCV